MSSLVLRYSATETNAPCGLCGATCAVSAGHQLFQAEGDAPVCTGCGRKHAPELAALLNLATAAERIGRMGRTSVFPPLTALLDLASAAERYSTSTQLRMTG